MTQISPDSHVSVKMTWREWLSLTYRVANILLTISILVMATLVGSGKIPTSENLPIIPALCEQCKDLVTKDYVDGKYARNDVVTRDWNNLQNQINSLEKKMDDIGKDVRDILRESRK